MYYPRYQINNFFTVGTYDPERRAVFAKI